MAISMAGFTLNDTLTKLSSESINMGQVMLIRGLFATALVTLIAWHQGALRRIGHALHPMVAIRVGGEAFATVCFLIALSHLPIANVSAVLQALPLAVTMGAAMVLAEPVGWRRGHCTTLDLAPSLLVHTNGYYGVTPTTWARVTAWLDEQSTRVR